VFLRALRGFVIYNGVDSGRPKLENWVRRRDFRERLKKMFLQTDFFPLGIMGNFSRNRVPEVADYPEASIAMHAFPTRPAISST
jgi:hypothetical protein